MLCKDASQRSRPGVPGAGLPHPPWVSDDADRGWQGARGASDLTDACVVRAGTQEDDPKNVRVSYVFRGKVHISEIAPPGTPHGPLLDRLLGSLNVPVEA